MHEPLRTRFLSPLDGQLFLHGLKAVPDEKQIGRAISLGRTLLRSHMENFYQTSTGNPGNFFLPEKVTWGPFPRKYPSGKFFQG